MTDKLFEFQFYDGQVFRGYGRDARDALCRLGLEAYNPVAYDVREITTNLSVRVRPEAPDAPAQDA